MSISMCPDMDLRLCGELRNRSKETKHFSIEPFFFISINVKKWNHLIIVTTMIIRHSCFHQVVNDICLFYLSQSIAVCFFVCAWVILTTWLCRLGFADLALPTWLCRLGFADVSLPTWLCRRGCTIALFAQLFFMEKWTYL